MTKVRAQCVTRIKAQSVARFVALSVIRVRAQSGVRSLTYIRTNPSFCPHGSVWGRPSAWPQLPPDIWVALKLELTFSLWSQGKERRLEDSE